MAKCAVVNRDDTIILAVPVRIAIADLIPGGNEC